MRVMPINCPFLLHHLKFILKDTPMENFRQIENEQTSVLPFLMGLLSFSLTTEIYQSIGNPANVAFVIISHLDLMILFWCSDELDKLSENSKRRQKLKVAVWSLSTILLLMITYRVASIMPSRVRVLLWVVAGLCISATFYACFLYREEPQHVLPVTLVPSTKNSTL